MKQCKVMLSGKIEKIPEGDGAEFVQWCQDYGWHPLNSARRAWCPSLGEYLRDADYLFHADAGFSAFIRESDILKSETEL